MKVFFFILFSFFIISCSETVKVACQSNDDCDNERICDLETNNCVKCTPSMCDYDNASGICKEDNGKVVCGFGECNKDYYNLDNNESNGCEYFCSISNGQVEICDSTDNNCDGEIDEGLECSCTNDESKDCFVLDTLCEGIQECSDGTWGACLSEDDTAGVEICDGLDNNCDEHIDENFKTGEIYTDNNHCGACNQVCLENNTSKNDCSLEGECNPVCNAGWTNLDKNGLNGCETGCSQEFFEEENHKIVAQKDGINNIIDSNSYYYDNSLLLAYAKENTFATNIYAKVINTNGEDVLDERNLTLNELGVRSFKPKTLKIGEYNYFLYAKSNNDFSINTIELLRKDMALDLGEVKDIKDYVSSAITASAAYDISKENYIEDSIFLAIESKDKAHLLSYNLSDKNIKDQKSFGETTRGGLKDIKITTSGRANDAYIVMAVCSEDTIFTLTKSSIKLFAIKHDYTNEAELSVEIFDDKECNNFAETGSIASDGTNFYVSYIDTDSNLIVKQYTYGIPRDSNDTIHKIQELLIYSQRSTEFATIETSNMFHRKENLIIALSKTLKNQETLEKSFSKEYIRLNGKLELKDSNIFVENNEIGFLETIFNDIFFTTDKEIILKFHTNIANGDNINISKTSACEN